MRKIWNDSAWTEYVYWQSQDKKTLKKIDALLKDIERSGGKGTGQAELLKGSLAGCASVRIDKNNRLVYRIIGEGDNQCLEIIQCGLHYTA
jgi:toxin YoeB